MITREDCLKIGEVTKTHNLQGNVVILSDSDLLERYADEPVFLLLEGAPVPFFIADEGLVVRNRNSYIVHFDGVDSLELAERLVGADVMLEKALLEDEEFDESDDDFSDLLDFKVNDTVSGAEGKVTDVVNYSGNVVLTLAILGKEILLPLSEMYISEVDMEHRRIQVNIPAELAELN